MKLSLAAFVATLVATIAASALPTQVGLVDFQAICLILCKPEKYPCSVGWYHKQLGKCWSCCKDVDVEFSVNADGLGRNAIW
ncbi:hypothetical protein FPV67DRAFT_337659 [Lyophyllum atratum]|nr:hypothetical protein FPV67DRAFT_337659 [Lyophyllum atratum]